MRAVDEDRRGRGYQLFVYVRGFQGHVGTILAIEEERELVAVADSQDDERGQPVGVSSDRARIDAFSRELLSDEPAHVIGADARNQSASQPKAGKPDRRVGGASADIFGERAHVLEPPTDLLAVEVNA